MILTITLNPCIDKSTRLPVLQPETKLRCETLVNEPGGGGINVSKALKRLLTGSRALFPAGGHNGNMLCSLLDQEGITYTRIDTENETRENWVVLETGTGAQYRFTFPGLSMPETVLDAVLKEIENPAASYVVISGSLPAGLSAAAFATIVTKVNATGARAIVDTSGAALAALKGANAYMIKPNAGELAALLGTGQLKQEEVPAAARQLVRDGYATCITVSMGALGAWLVTENEAWFTAAPPVKKMSTVGAGDSMVAGMVYQLLQQAPLDQVLRFGVACGTAATMNAGTQLFHKEDAERLFGEMNQ